MSQLLEAVEQSCGSWSGLSHQFGTGGESREMAVGETQWLDENSSAGSSTWCTEWCGQVCVVQCHKVAWCQV